MDKPLVVVIIVNFNGLDDTLECLNSLRSTTYPNFRVIVVDNASRENPMPVITREFPDVHCFRNDLNLGFTGGNNLGLAKALEVAPKYIFFLNNDTVVNRDSLSTLVQFMEGHPEVGIAGPLTYYYDCPEIVSFCGGNLNRNTGQITFIGKGTRLPGATPEVIPCTFVEGAAIFIRTDLVKKIRGFNDDYFLTSEESELCVRIADMGYKLAVLTTCSIRHKVSRSMGAGSELINYFVYRNRLYFIRNNATHFHFEEFFTVLSNYIRSLGSLILKERNIGAAKGLIHGVIDFFRNVKGPGRYQKKLQPNHGSMTQ